TRFKRLTWQPCDSHRRRTSRLRPSLSSTRNQSCESVPPMRSIASNFAGPSSSATPRASRSTILSDTVSSPSGARTRHTYSRSISCEGCIIALASSPSVVSSSRPVVLMSRRPIEIQRAPLSAGSESRMVGRPSGSSRVVTSPSGLLYISTRGGSVSAVATNMRPSTSMRAPPAMLMPTVATSPLTLTMPSAMRCSSARREPSPACASTLCSRSSRRGCACVDASPRFSDSRRLPLSSCSLMFLPGAFVFVGGCRVGSGFGVGIGAGPGARVVRRFAVFGRDVAQRHRVGLRLRLGGAVECELRFQLADVLEFGQRRQVVQPLQPEVVEERLGRGQQFRLAGNIAVADHPDPVAFLERLDDVAVDRDAADLFDLAAGDRLSVGDQRQRLQGGAGVAGLAFGPQPRDPLVHVGLDLVAVPRRDLDQFHATVAASLLQGSEGLLNGALGRLLVEREQP